MSPRAMQRCVAGNTLAASHGLIHATNDTHSSEVSPVAWTLRIPHAAPPTSIYKLQQKCKKKKKSLRAESGQRGNGKEFVDGKQGICTVTYRTVCRETSLLEGRTHCDEFNAHRHRDAKLCLEHATTKALAGPIILLHNDALQVQVLLVIQPFAADAGSTSLFTQSAYLYYLPSQPQPPLPALPARLHSSSLHLSFYSSS